MLWGGGGEQKTDFGKQVSDWIQDECFEGGEGSQLHIFVTRLEICFNIKFLRGRSDARCAFSSCSSRSSSSPYF